MITISDKTLCCGCTACVSACPAQCIVMRRDREEGFDYPVANPDNIPANIQISNGLE